MTDRTIIYKSISKTAYGYILILVAVMIGTIDILPDFIGYIMMLYAIEALKGECKTISLLKPFGYALAVWKAIVFILRAFGIGVISISSFNPAAAFLYIIYIIGIIINIISIYFDYQLLTEMSLLAKKYQKEQDSLDRKFIVRRNINTVCMTLAFSISNLSNVFQDIPQDIAVILVIIPAVLSLFVMFLVVTALFSLRKLFKGMPPETGEENAEFSEPPSTDLPETSIGN